MARGRVPRNGSPRLTRGARKRKGCAVRRAKRRARRDTASEIAYQLGDIDTPPPLWYEVDWLIW